MHHKTLWIGLAGLAVTYALTRTKKVGTAKLGAVTVVNPPASSWAPIVNEIETATLGLAIP